MDRKKKPGGRQVRTKDAPSPPRSWWTARRASFVPGAAHACLIRRQRTGGRQVRTKDALSPPRSCRQVRTKDARSPPRCVVPAPIMDGLDFELDCMQRDCRQNHCSGARNLAPRSLQRNPRTNLIQQENPSNAPRVLGHRRARG